jgi:hypothetical protein
LQETQQQKLQQKKKNNDKIIVTAKATATCETTTIDFGIHTRCRSRMEHII